jgi:hypothetical protein
MGGCPEFRNDSVTAIDTATRAILLSAAESDEALGTARTGILSAALELFFDQFRTDEVS